jgi:hypothetical protein
VIGLTVPHDCLVGECTGGFADGVAGGGGQKVVAAP